MMAARNPSISISVKAGESAKEVNKLASDLKMLRKEFEVSNTAIEAEGNALALAQNKLKQYGEETKIVKKAAEAMAKGISDAESKQSQLAAKVAAAKQAYESAAKAEGKSKEEVAKLKKEYEDLSSRLTHAENNVAKWKNALQNAQIAENKLTKSTNDVNREIAELNKKHVENINNTKNVTSATGQLLNVYTLIKGLALGYAGKTLFETLIGGNSQFEQYMASFEVLLGGAEQAQKRMDELTVFAAKTPFELPQVVEAEKRLLAYGVTAKDTAKVMQMLGDISMGNAEKLNMISLAYGQVVTNQKLYGTELRQFAENGVPLLEALANMYGVTAAEMRGMVEDGQIGADAVTAALTQMTSEGGKFYGMMDKQSQTMKGMWSTLKDNINMFARDVGDESFGYLKGALTDFMDTLDRMSESGELKEVAEEWGQGIAKFIGFVVNAVKILWDMKEALIAVGAALVITKTLNAAAAAFNVLSATVLTVKSGFDAAKVSNDMLNASLIKSPWGAVAAVIGIVAGALITHALTTKSSADETDNLINKTKQLNQEYENNVKAIDRQTNSSLGETEIARRLAGELETLASSTNKSAEEKARMVQIVDQLNEKIPNLALAINSETGELNKQIGVVYDSIDAYKQLLFVKAAEKKSSAAAENLIGTKDTKARLEQEYKKLQEEYAVAQSKLPTLEDFKNGKGREYGSEAQEVENLAARMQRVSDAIKNADAFINRYEGDIQNAFDMSKDYAEKYGTKYDFDSGSGNSAYTPPPLLNSADDSKKAAKEAEKAYQEAVQKEFSDLKFLKDMEYITEAEYYDRLAGLRDAYYAEGSSEWQQYTLEIKQYHDELAEKANEEAKKALQAKREEFQKRRALSDSWLSDEKYYNRSSIDNEIAGYERIKTYVEDYYNQGIISYEEYIDQIKDLDKQIYDAERRKYEERRQNSDNWIAEQKEAGTLTSEQEIAAYERIKAYTEQFYKEGIISYEEYIAKIKELDRDIANTRKNANQKEYNDILSGAENFIDTEEFYDRALSPEKQTEIYEGLKKVAEDYYKKSTITYEEYIDKLNEIDKKIYSVRKKSMQDYIDDAVDAEKDALDKRKEALEQEEKEIKDSYEDRKAAIEAYYDELDLNDTRNERADKLTKLREDEAKYARAATTEGKEKLKQIQDEIKELNKEAIQEQRKIDMQAEISKAKLESDKLEEDRLRRAEKLKEQYENLDDAQKTLLKNIGEYATASAGTIEEVTKKIQTLIAAVNTATSSASGGKSSTSGTSSGSSANTTTNSASIVINDYGNKILSGPEDVRDYSKELTNGAVNAAAAKGLKFKWV